MFVCSSVFDKLTCYATLKINAEKTIVSSCSRDVHSQDQVSEIKCHLLPRQEPQ